MWKTTKWMTKEEIDRRYLMILPIRIVHIRSYKLIKYTAVLCQTPEEKS